MADTTDFEPGGYRYIPAFFQYSGGVRALPGFRLERVRFKQARPLAEAFEFIEARLGSIDRPLTAFAHCELRSPEPFTDAGFIEFNRLYTGTLENWGIFKNEINPVARTNVCPMYDKPAVPSMQAFSFTVADTEESSASFLVSGGGDARAGKQPYAERIVRYGDTSPEALREKVQFVFAEMSRRLAKLGVGWQDASLVQAYTVQNIGHLIGCELAESGAARQGLLWHYARPPVLGLEFEMDVIGVLREVYL